MTSVVAVETKIPYSLPFSVDVPDSTATAKAMIALADRHFENNKSHYWKQITEHWEKYGKVPTSLCSCVMVGDNKLSDNYNMQETKQQFMALANGRFTEIGCFDMYDDGPRACIGPSRFKEFAPDKMSQKLLDDWMTTQAKN